MTVDVPQLRKELEYITANRLHWNQGSWLKRTSCGTVGCLAGNTVLNAGYLPLATSDGFLNYVSRERVPCNEDGYFVVVAGRDNSLLANGVPVERVSDCAQRLLGLSDVEANLLFSGDNSLYRLWAIASRITHGEIEIPPEVADDRFCEYRPNGRAVVRGDEEAREDLRVRRGFVRDRQLPSHGA